MSARVVLVASTFPKLSEGFLVSKFAGLIEAGWDAHVVCTRSERSEWGRLVKPLRRPAIRRRVRRAWPHRPRWLAAVLYGPSLLRCAVRNPRGSWRYMTRGWRRLGTGVFRHLYLDAEIIGLAPDLIHFEFGSLAVGRMHLPELLGSRVVVSFRGYDLNFAGLDEPGYYEEVWREAAGVHVLGEHLWREARRRGCPPGKRHVLIPPAIAVEEFEAGPRREGELGTAERPLRILSVGRLDWKKGYEYGLAAVARLVARGVVCEYRIVGDGEYRPLVAFARHQLGLEGVVELLGARPLEEVRKQLMWADVFLHAAVSEGFCNAVVEAQAMRLPVVCTDAGGLPENVEGGVTGFVVSRRDPGALAEKLEVLARDSGLRWTMGEEARRRARGMFRVDEQIERFGKLYGDVMEAAPSEGLGAERTGIVRRTEEAPR